MEHLELELLRLADHVLIERNDVAVADAKTRCVEVECRILLGSDTDTYIYRGLYKGVKRLELTHVIKDRNDVLPSIVREICNVLNVCRFLETVADNELIPIYNTLSLKCFNEVEIEC